MNVNPLQKVKKINLPHINGVGGVEECGHWKSSGKLFIFFLINSKISECTA